MSYHVISHHNHVSFLESKDIYPTFICQGGAKTDWLWRITQQIYARAADKSKRISIDSDSDLAKIVELADESEVVAAAESGGTSSSFTRHQIIIIARHHTVSTEQKEVENHCQVHTTDMINLTILSRYAI